MQLHDAKKQKKNKTKQPKVICHLQMCSKIKCMLKMVVIRSITLLPSLKAAYNTMQTTSIAQRFIILFPGSVTQRSTVQKVYLVMIHGLRDRTSSGDEFNMMNVLANFSC